MNEQPPQAVVINQVTNSNQNSGMGTASHLLGSLLNLIFPLFCWVGPLILYATNNNEDTILKHHLAQSLNASITFSLALLIHFALMLVCLGFITVLVHWIMYVIWSINANNALKAGQMYDYPFTISFVNP
jgi:uncharacterized Tic20 family protein